MDEEEYIWKMCESKVRIKNKERAERRLRMVKQSGKMVPENVQPYKCIYCGGWHLGHSKERNG